jgi:small subunit ribosomal protein S1
MEQQGSDLQQQRLATWVSTVYDYRRPRPGEVHEAVVLSIAEDEVIVHIAETKRDGMVPPRDLQALDDTYRETLKEGARVPVRILRGQSRDNQILVSLKQGLQHRDWLRAEQLLESGEVFQGQVCGANRGGLLVSFGRVRGFVPNSHLRRGRPRELEAKSKLVDETLSLIVLEVNQRRRRLVLSERMANARQREQLMKELAEGQIRKGIVSNLVDYGAFVDLGGVDGLVHISEIDWEYIDHPRDVLSVGDELEVQVLKVDPERGRIGLSRKRVLPNPWYDVVENLYEGDLVEGTVRRIVSYGAFVEIGKGIQGLAHVSDTPGGQSCLAQLVAGSQLTVRVLRIDDARQRIALAIPDHADLETEGSVQDTGCAPAEQGRWDPAPTLI